MFVSLKKHKFYLYSLWQKLENIVMNKVDMFAFKPMDRADCVQVSKLFVLMKMLSIEQKA